LLEQLANLGELIGGIGALAALIYLAAQVRQSNRIARAASRQKLLDTFYDRTWETGTNPELARVLAAGLMRWDSLSNRDKTTFHAMMTRWVSNVDSGMALREEGLVGDEPVRFIAMAMANCIKSPGGERWWLDTKRDELVAPALATYLESLLADPSLQIEGFHKSLPFWAALADEGHSEGDNPPAG
jgi:hypothetical protein